MGAVSVMRQAAGCTMRVVVCGLILAGLSRAADATSGADLSLGDILDLRAVTLSKRLEDPERAPGTVYIWGEKEIRAYGFRNLREVLEATPGFETVNFYFWLNGGQRGYNDNMGGTLVLIDGRKMMMEFFKESYIMEQYPLDMVRQIEVVQGPISALYGSEALQGVVHIITKGAGAYHDYGSLHLRAGSFADKALSVGLRRNWANDGRVWASVSWHETDNPDLGSFVDDEELFGLNTNPRRIHTDDSLGSGYFYSPNEEMSANVRFESALRVGGVHLADIHAGLDLWHLVSAGGIESVGLTVGMNHQERKVLQPYIGLTRSFLDGVLRVKLEEIYHYERAFFRGNLTAHTVFDSTVVADSAGPVDTIVSARTVYPTAFANSGPSHMSSTILQVDADFKPIDNHLIMGVEGTYVDYGHQMWSLDDGRYYVPEGSVYDSREDETNDTLFRQRGMTAYIYDQQRLLDRRLTLSGGIRYNWQDFYEDAVVPRFGVVVSPWSFLNLKYSYGQGFKTLSMFGLMGPGSTSYERKPSTMKAHDLSMVFSWSALENRLSFENSLSAYVNESTDYTLQQIAGAAQRFTNVKNEFGSRGIENQLKLVYGSRFTATFGLSYVETSEIEVEGEKTEHYNVPAYKLHAAAWVRLWRGLSLATTIKAQSAVDGEAISYHEPDETELITIPGFAVLDLKLAYEGRLYDRIGLLVRGSVHNALDEQYYHINARGTAPKQYLQEPRSYSLQVGLEL